MKTSCALAVATLWAGVGVGFVLTRRALAKIPQTILPR